jgi:hypothetical protein
MTGGSLHWPLWGPYEIYMRTDFIYGWKAFNEKNGFTAAQGSMNIPETLLYLYYLYLVYSQSTQSSPAHGGAKRRFLAQKHVAGRSGALAVVVGFTAAVMTFSKTLLYGAYSFQLCAILDHHLLIAGLNEAFSGWSNVGHNEWINLVLFWIIPK